MILNVTVVSNATVMSVGYAPANYERCFQHHFTRYTLQIMTSNNTIGGRVFASVALENIVKKNAINTQRFR